MNGRHGRCLAQSRFSGNVSGLLPLTGRNIGWTFTATWGCTRVAGTQNLLTFINWEILLQTPKFPAFGGALLRSREDSRLIPLYALGGEAWLSPRGSGAVTRAPWLPSEPPLNYPPPSPRPVWPRPGCRCQWGGGGGRGDLDALGNFFVVGCWV